MHFSEWSFQQPSILATIFSVAMLIALIVLTFIHFSRNASGTRGIIITSLRLAVILMIGATLIRPEQITREILSKEPEIVVLVDDTASMLTQDLELGNGDIISRYDWVELDSKDKKEFWEGKFSEHYKVSVKKLSEYQKDLDNPGSPNGTNINRALIDIQQKNENLRAVMVLSDGDWNMGGSPVEAATELQMKQARIFALSIGSKKYLEDLALDNVKTQTFCLRNEKMTISFPGCGQ